MNQKKLVTLTLVGLLWVVGLVTAEQSQANDYERRANRGTARWEVDRHNNRSDWAELGKDRAELRRDQAELERDRADLLRLYRRGASRSEIDRKKAEIRNDLREIGQDRHEIWDDYGVRGVIAPAAGPTIEGGRNATTKVGGIGVTAGGTAIGIAVTVKNSFRIFIDIIQRSHRRGIIPLPRR